MRKFTMILSLLVAMCTTAMAEELVVSTTLPGEGTPENLFTMVNGNGLYVGKDAVDGVAGKFAFYAVDGVENAYYIYSVDAEKWFNYELAASYEVKKNFVTLSDSRENYFHFEKCTTNNTHYQIRPYNTTGVAAKYLNWYQGADGSATLGLWTDNGDTDNGSRYLLETYVERVYVSTLEGFDQNKCYTMTTAGRGAWTVSGDQFKTTSDASEAVSSENENQHFAVLSLDNENYYLYSVAAKKFVKFGAAGYGLLVTGVGDPIVLHDASSFGVNRVMVQFKGQNVYFNIGGNNQACLNAWGANAGEIDGGNAILFTEVGDFDPAEALAMLSNVADVTYNFQLDGVTVATQTETVDKGAAYPEFNVPNVRLGIVPAVAKPDGTVTVDTTLNIALAVDNTLLPFEFVESGTPAVWYYAKIHSNFPSYMGANGDNNNIYWKTNGTGDLISSFSGTEADAYTWGFVGNVIDGFKMVNKNGQAINSTGGDGDNVTLGDAASATAFVAMPTGENVANGFCMMNSASNSYMNAHDGYVKHWTDNDAGSTIQLTEREDFNITVSDVRYATLYLDYDAYIPEGVEVYYVAAIDGNGYADMTQVEGEAIPANQGFILNANAGEYTFVKAIVAGTGVAAIGTNLLKGSVVETEIGENCYVLANGENGIGFYGVEEGVSGANKAYLEVPATEGSAAFYGFLFEGTTGVENVVVENGAQVIFDLTGRRIESINAAGIYIVNGKKVLVK